MQPAAPRFPMNSLFKTARWQQLCSALVASSIGRTTLRRPHPGWPTSSARTYSRFFFGNQKSEYIAVFSRIQRSGNNNIIRHNNAILCHHFSNLDSRPRLTTSENRRLFEVEPLALHGRPRSIYDAVFVCTEAHFIASILQQGPPASRVLTETHSCLENRTRFTTGFSYRNKKRPPCHAFAGAYETMDEEVLGEPVDIICEDF